MPNVRVAFRADHPRCPRCRTDIPGRPLPAEEYAGFLAKRDEGPILDEEERYAARNLVTMYPQWDGDVIGRWSTASGWGLRLSRNEEVRWLNEGLPPTVREIQQNIPYLHDQGKGYLICGLCGHLLTPEEPQTAQGSRRQPRRGNRRADPFGHREGCLNAGTAPNPVAIEAIGRAELLRLIIPVPTGMIEAQLNAWAISFGFALRNGMRHLYMLDGSEIDFLPEGPWLTTGEPSCRVISMTFSDPSLGGTGYLRKIADDLHLVARAAIEHLDHIGCETACYRCLKSYHNQRYHDILNWPITIASLEDLAQTPTQARDLQTGDIDDPTPWLEAYAEGVGSPLELKFLRLFEQHDFHPDKQVPVAPSVDQQPISVADFGVPARRLAIYIDGAAFHTGQNLRRDRWIRDRLRNGTPPWTVVELRAADLAQGKALVEEIKRKVN